MASCTSGHVYPYTLIIIHLKTLRDKLKRTEVDLRPPHTCKHKLNYQYKLLSDLLGPQPSST
ncbi:hypothetical protein ACRRTK_020710 [Alexandromys fortis]